MLVLTGTRPHAAVVSDVDAQQALGILEQTESDWPVLLLCRSGVDEHEARLVRTSLGRPGIGVLAINQSETRFKLLAYCASNVTPQLLAQVPAVVELALRALRTRVVLTSVSKVTAPAPSLLQHVQGLLPGSKFCLDLEQSTVSRVTTPGWEPPTKASLSVWAADDHSGRVSGALASMGIHREQLLPISHTWPAKNWAEMSWLTIDPRVIVSRALEHVSRARCARCGSPALPQGCVLCGTWPHFPVQDTRAIPDAVQAAPATRSYPTGHGRQAAPSAVPAAPATAPTHSSPPAPPQSPPSVSATPAKPPSHSAQPQPNLPGAPHARPSDAAHAEQQAPAWARPIVVTNSPKPAAPTSAPLPPAYAPTR